jgi:hypothetical protein
MPPVALHTFPHAPQFDKSLRTSTHEPEQSTRSPSQVGPLHAPVLQVSPSPHAVLQLPQ